MFGRTRIYSVYVKQGAINPLESAIFIKQGFNFYAFLFTVFWSLYNRLWLLSIAIGLVSAFFAYNDGTAFILASLLFGIWFGFEANNFRSAKLEKKGCLLFDISIGTDKLAAQARFYDKYLLNKPQTSKPAAASMRQAAF